jgi:hypothetical protein
MDNIKDILARVGALVESGDALERDLALQLLREVYSAIKLSPSQDASPALGDGRRSVDDAHPPFGDFGSHPLPPPSQGDEEGPKPVDQTASEGEDCGAPEVEEKTAGEPTGECEVEEEEPVAEPCEHAAPEEEPVTEEPTATETQEWAEEEPTEEKPAPEKPAVETREPSIVPRRVAPDIIRSLYGSETDDDERAPEVEAKPLPRPREFEPKSDPREAEAKHRREAEPKTLGDAMTAGHRTLGETLRNGGGHDMASRIAAAERPSLKRSIGLNDRFLMIRDMFDGDAGLFDRTITRLDAFTDLDEAVVWIRDNFDWSADSKGVALLIALLERKLGR